jgi:hypothetical protein
MEGIAMVHDVNTSRLSGGFGLDRAAHGMPGTRLGLASATRDVDASLSVVTKEGDTVTLSASYDASVTYAAMGRRGHHGHGASFMSAQSQSSVSLQVTGDLNAQELADIRQVVERFMQDMRAMERGGDASVADVATFDATTLQSISATASTSTTVTLAGLSGRGPAQPTPVVPVVTAGPGQDSPARPAGLTSEDAGLLPADRPMLPARGPVTPLPVSIASVFEDVTAATN